MNPLGAQVLLVAKEYLGPASQQFLSKELRGLECTADTITPWHLPALSERARAAASRIMDAERADEFGRRVAGLAVARATSTTKVAGHVKDGGAPRVGLDSAARLFTSGKLRQAEEAYRALAQKHGDAEAFRGLAHTQVALEDLGAAVLALRDGAASLARKGDRAAALALLIEAVAIAPGGLAAHRRLAAAQAHARTAAGPCGQDARTITSVDAFDEAPVDLATRIAPRTKEAVRKFSQAAWKARPAVDLEATLAALAPGATPEQRAAATAMRASVLIAARDGRAT